MKLLNSVVRLALGVFILGNALVGFAQAEEAKKVEAVQWAEAGVTSGVFFSGDDLSLELRVPATISVNQIKFVWTNAQGKSLADETVKVKPAGDAKVARTVLGKDKAKVNGVYAVKAFFKAGSGKEDYIERQVAVIPKREIVAGQYDRESPYSVNAMDLDLASKIGARKLRHVYRTEEDFAKLAASAKANGILFNGLLIDGPIVTQDALPKSITKAATEVTNVFTRLKKQFPDQVYAQEIHNEPENWPPTPPANLFIPLAKIVSDVTMNMHTAKEDIAIISPGSTHVNLSLLHQIATVGGDNSPDIIAVHGYRSPCRPEFGYAENISAIRDLFGDKPIYCNEDAYFALSPNKHTGETSITVPHLRAIELDEVTQGIYLQRSFLNQIAAGYSLVTQFSGLENHDLSAGVFHRRPGLANYAALTSLLPHPKFVKRLTAEVDNLWAMQWTNDAEIVTTLWTLNKPVKISLSSSSALKCYDTYGNLLSEGKTLEVVVGGAPLFVKGGGIAISEPRELVASDSLPTVVLPEEVPEKPVAVSFRGEALNMKESRIVAVVKNNSAAKCAGTISLEFLADAPKAWKLVPDSSDSFSLEPGAVAEIAFRPESSDPATPFDPYNPVPGKGYLALWWAQGYQVVGHVKLADGQLLEKHQNSRLCLRGIPQMPKVEIDGDLADWKDVPVFPQLGANTRSAELFQFWRGRSDYLPTFKIAWSPAGLLFAADVIDDVNDVTQTGLNAWRTDSIQLGLNTRLGQPDFTDYLVLTFGAGGSAVLQRDTPKLKAGKLSGIRLVTKRVNPSTEQEGRTTYEALIPWAYLQMRPEAGKQLTFSAQFNESDGWWRRGWEGYFVGMGGQIVDPRYFGDLTLVK